MFKSSARVAMLMWLFTSCTILLLIIYYNVQDKEIVVPVITWCLWVISIIVWSFFWWRKPEGWNDIIKE